MAEPRWCDLPKKQKLAAITENVPREVAEAVEKHFRGKPIPADPMAAINVVLRESWRAEHGDTAEWDRVAAADGVVIR
jgi:hypothetical protein